MRTRHRQKLRHLFMTAKDAAIFSEALREAFPTARFIDGEDWPRPEVPVRASLADCTDRAINWIVVPDRAGWKPRAKPSSLTRKRFVLSNRPRHALRMYRAQWQWEAGWAPGNWAWDPPFLEAGHIACVYDPDDPADKDVPAFVRRVWRIIEKVATNRIKGGHPYGNELMGCERVLMADGGGGMYWAGYHALAWCRAGGPRRMLGGCYRPRDDWAPPDSEWYRALLSRVEERYGADLGNPPEAPPERVGPWALFLNVRYGSG